MKVVIKQTEGCYENEQIFKRYPILEKYRNKMMIKCCPFCGGVDIRFSQKTCSTRRDEHKYYVAMYCKNCNCYGARAIVEISKEDFDKFGYQCVEDKFRDLAIRNWNRRAKGTGVEYEQK